MNTIAFFTTLLILSVLVVPHPFGVVFRFAPALHLTGASAHHFATVGLIAYERTLVNHSQLVWFVFFCDFCTPFGFLSFFVQSTGSLYGWCSFERYCSVLYQTPIGVVTMLCFVSFLHVLIDMLCMCNFCCSFFFVCLFTHTTYAQSTGFLVWLVYF